MTRVGLRSTSVSASPRSRPCRGPQSGCFATSCPSWPQSTGSIPSAKVCLIERAIPGSWAGRLVSELEEPGRVKVAAIGRLGVAQIPKPDLVAQEGDVAYVAVSGDAIAAFDELLAQGSKGRH